MVEIEKKNLGILIKVRKLVGQKMPKLPYHNYSHIKKAILNIRKLSKIEKVNKKQLFLLETATLLHDIIYYPGRKDNEKKSSEFASVNLQKRGYSQKDINSVVKLILATKLSYKPKNLLEKIIKDADLSHLGTKKFFEISEKLKEELSIKDELKWDSLQLDFLQSHKYYTKSAKKLMDPEKNKNISLLNKKIRQLNKKTLIAGWSFTNICNLKCKHCYNASGKRKKNELSFKESLAIADKLKKEGVVAVNFGGGECALRHDFIKLCKYLHKLGIKISYTTNGTTFHLIKEYLYLFHDIGVSIDFSDAKKHDSFRGVEGTFHKAVSTIKELVKRGVDTEIVTCITKLNCSPKELEKIYDLAKSLKVNYWRLNRFRKNGRGKNNEDKLDLSKQQLKNSYKFLNKLIPINTPIPEPIFRAAFGGNYSIEGDPSGNTAFRIQANGEVTPSLFLSISGGNIKEKSLNEIFNSEIFKAIRERKPIGKCKNCPEYEHCLGGDAGVSFLEYGHFNGPDPLCWILNKRKKRTKKIQQENWNVHERYLCTVYVPIKGVENEKINTKLPKLDLNITNRCNFRCIHCAFDSGCFKMKEFSLSKIREVLIDTKKIGGERFDITGGEPLVRKDLIEIIQIGKELGYKIELVTNGSLLSKKKLLEFKKLKLDSIAISLDGSNYEIYNKIRKVSEKTYKNVLKNIKLAILLGFKVKINTVAFNSNYGDIPNITQFCIKNHVVEHGIYYFTPIGRGKLNDRLSIEPRKWIAFLRKNLTKYKDKIKISLEIPLIEKKKIKKEICCIANAEQYHLQILPNGDVFPCAILASYNKPIANINNKKITEIWKNKKLWEIYWELILKTFKKKGGYCVEFGSSFNIKDYKNNFDFVCPLRKFSLDDIK